MRGEKKLFMDLDEKVNSVAKFGDDRKIIVKKKGMILIRARNREHIIISDVFNVPGLESNILSVGQFKKRDVSFT